MAILLFKFTAKRNLDVFLCKFAHGLFFGFASLFLCLTNLLVLFFLFSYQTHDGLVFQISLLVFRK